MLLEHSFEIPVDESRAWDVLLDLPRVVPCIPAAELVEGRGDGAWSTRMRVKLGPVLLDFVNEITLEKADPEARVEAISGNLCRCTGCQNIGEAVRLAVARVHGGVQ